MDDLTSRSELKPCPFCGGAGKISFKDYGFGGQNGFGDKEIKYRTQVICNRCRSRGKPIITDWLINPNPYVSKWGNCGDGTSPNGLKQTSMFKPYVEQAIEAWNRRARQPEIIFCKDCKHRPFDGEDTQGFGVEFPDAKCPCQCDDGWYNWRPNDAWFCGNAERRTDEQTD